MKAVLGVAWVTVIVFSSSFAVRAQDCQCKGSDPEIFSGGDGAPLRWLYETRMLMRASSSAPATRCYHRSVLNNSASPVRDIRWEIANFARRIIFSNHISATCLPIQGDVKAQPSVGPLYFDVSSQGYETTTRQPERGWTEALVAPGDSSAGNLITNVSFDTDNGSGSAGELGFLYFESRALRKDTDTNILLYDILNDSGVPLRVLVNLPTTPQFAKDVPIVQESLEIMPKKWANLETVAFGPVSTGVFSILITDGAGRVVALDSGSFWFPANGELRHSNADLWKQATRSEK